jgi:hypothetical protein
VSHAADGRLPGPTVDGLLPGPTAVDALLLGPAVAESLLPASASADGLLAAATDGLPMTTNGLPTAVTTGDGSQQLRAARRARAR